MERKERVHWRLAGHDRVFIAMVGGEESASAASTGVRDQCEKLAETASVSWAAWSTPPPLLHDEEGGARKNPTAETNRGGPEHEAAKQPDVVGISSDTLRSQRENADEEHERREPLKTGVDAPLGKCKVRRRRSEEEGDESSMRER